VASEKQAAANRRNALRSTGPRTVRGKLRSRRNAFQHGLTAETVIHSLEHRDAYERLQSDLIEDLAPATAVEQALVTRLASLLWRLRRAIQIESGLFELTASTTGGAAGGDCHPAMALFYGMLTPVEPHSQGAGPHLPRLQHRPDPVRPNAQLARIYQRICNSPAAMKRLSRYETALWRQVGQSLLLLQTLQTGRFVGPRISRRQ
jgi:hypothetical protein